MNGTFSSYFLIGLLALLAVGAIPSGFLLIWDPTGSTIGFPPVLFQELEGSPFSDFRVPGIFLLLFLGLLPAFTVYGLLTKRKLRAIQGLNPHKNQHWSWTLSYCIGLILIFWINMQLFFGIGFHLLHFGYILLGVLIVFVTLLPNTQKQYVNS